MHITNDEWAMVCFGGYIRENYCTIIRIDRFIYKDSPCVHNPVMLCDTQVHINSSPPNATYMRPGTGASLFQIMACRLFGAKSLLESMPVKRPVYSQLDSWEYILLKFESEFIIFVQENAVENVVCQNGGHFVTRGMSQQARKLALIMTAACIIQTSGDCCNQGIHLKIILNSNISKLFCL